MTVHIALLRAVNLAGHAAVAMADLRTLLTDLGCSDVRSVLQSGNLVFGSDEEPAALEDVLETEAQKRLGLKTDIMVRTAAQWDQIVARNPFPQEAEDDPAHLVVLLCKTVPGRTLKVTGVRREIVRADGRQVYIVYPDGIGRSKLKLDVRGTARNWNTVLKLAALANG